MTAFIKGSVCFDIHKTSDYFKNPDGKLPEALLRRFIRLETRSQKSADQFVEAFRSESPDAEQVEWEEGL